MAFNGTGTFVRLYNWVADAAAAINITASRMDAETDGIASGLSNCITRDGQGKPTAAINWNGQNLTNVATFQASGTSTLGAVTATSFTGPLTGTVTGHATLDLPLTGGVMSGAISGVTDLTTTGNTILGDASTDTLNVGNGGLIKDASGNVGVGTAANSIVGKLNVRQDSGDGPIFVLENRVVNAATHKYGSLVFSPYRDIADPVYGAAVWGEGASAAGYDAALVFGTSTNGAASTFPTERLRIDASGNVMVGGTAASFGSAGRGVLEVNGSSAALYGFKVGGVAIGNIFHDGTNLGLTNQVAAGLLTLGTNSVGRLTITADGRVYGTGIHNNAGSMTGTANQYIGSGTYTPTLTNGANVAASTAYVCQWMRVGNVVTVSGRLDQDSTTINTLTSLGISLPIASTLGAINALGGTGVADPSATGTTGRIYADVANNRAVMDSRDQTSIANLAWAFTFTYVVL